MAQLPRVSGQSAQLVVGQKWAHSTGWASSPSIRPAGDVEATEEWLEVWLHPSVTWEEKASRGESAWTSNTSRLYCHSILVQEGQAK